MTVPSVPISVSSGSSHRGQLQLSSTFPLATRPDCCNLAQDAPTVYDFLRPVRVILQDLLAGVYESNSIDQAQMVPNSDNHSD